MRSEILVSGLINIETTLLVEGFPIPYNPVRYPFFGVNSTVSGVGFNIALALQALGDRPRLLSLVGRDLAGELVMQALKAASLPSEGVLQELEQTAQSVILYDRTGDRSINTDLKDIQDKDYPAELFLAALSRCSLVVLCNINFSRPYLKKARQAGKLVATDVHAIASLEDEYNRDFMENADILFMSDERLPCSPEQWVHLVLERFPAEIVVVGMGAQGALLAVRSQSYQGRFPAVYTRPVISTVGAGDALFSAFVHFYHESGDPYWSLKLATTFASFKIGETRAAEGFLPAQRLFELVK
jgi:acarbose 7IV-phosphotransferase